jgi:hypothetical protein
MREMQNICLCLECGWEYPSQLDRGHPDLLTNKSVVAAGVFKVQMQVTYASDIIKWFQLKSMCMKGQPLLDHLSVQRRISFNTPDKELYAPNDCLDLAMKPCNVKILKHMTAPDLSNRSVMQDCEGNGATLNLAARKLNQKGYIHHHCGLVNTEDKVRKLKNALQLSQSMATISNEQINDAAQKKIELQVVMLISRYLGNTRRPNKSERRTAVQTQT